MSTQPDDVDRNLEHEKFRLLDPITEAWLADVGLPGHSLGETVDVDGEVSLWVVHRDCLGEDGVDHGDEAPRHELGGPLPAHWRDRVRLAPLRCSRPTTTGRPCRAVVPTPNTTCHHHRGDTP